MQITEKEKQTCIKRVGARKFSAYEWRQQSVSFKEIGRRLGVSTTRARAMCQECETALKDTTHWACDLSARTSNTLQNCGFESREQVLEAFNNGKLIPGPGGPRNYGWSRHKEVAAWLNLPEPQKPAVVRFNKAVWVQRSEGNPPEGSRVLIFSPVYPKGHEMRYRIIDAQFFQKCEEATHWLNLHTFEFE